MREGPRLCGGSQINQGILTKYIFLLMSVKNVTDFAFLQPSDALVFSNVKSFHLFSNEPYFLFTYFLVCVGAPRKIMRVGPQDSRHAPAKNTITYIIIFIMICHMLFFLKRMSINKNVNTLYIYDNKKNYLCMLAYLTYFLTYKHFLKPNIQYIFLLKKLIIICLFFLQCTTR